MSREAERNATMQRILDVKQIILDSNLKLLVNHRPSHGLNTNTLFCCRASRMISPKDSNRGVTRLE